jgi:hypothetical protein
MSNAILPIDQGFTSIHLPPDLNSVANDQIFRELALIRVEEELSGSLRLSVIRLPRSRKTRK